MGIIETIILGLIQGLTEFIPISSSGHLVIAQTLFSGASDHLFLEYINIGTTLALFVYFRVRIWDIIRDIFVARDYRLAGNILLTSIPAGVVGFILADLISTNAVFSSVVTVMVTLAVVGILMVLLERLPKASQVPALERLPWLRALAIGGAQMLALIPGTSRSGATIVAGRLLGLSREHAAEYSFLASLPIMVGVSLKVLLDSGGYADHVWLVVLGNAVAFGSGLFAVGFLMNFLRKHTLAVFGWYRIALAVIIGVWLFVLS